jgi:diguanylate cyclase (GGDEF)-like protein/PAS domain S-box-containing protein
MLVATSDGAVIDANETWCSLTGLPVADTLGVGWLDVLAPADRASVRRLIAQAEIDAPGECVDAALRSPGPIEWGRWSVARLPTHELREPAVVIALVDLTRDRAQTAALRHAATHDPLTSAANRPLFLETTRHSLARLRRHRGCVGVLFIDLDGFKTVNDDFGHLAGDRVLTIQAQRLRATLRPADVLARMGGDEFAVLCEDLDGPDQIDTIARRAAAGLAEPIMMPTNRTIAIPASIGAVITTDPGGTPERLVDIADHAMYRAKHRRGTDPEIVVELESPNALACRAGAEDGTAR